jgi:hypothetical protein
VEGRQGGPFQGLFILVGDMTNEDVLILSRTMLAFDLYRLAAAHVLAWNVEVPVWGEADAPEDRWGGTEIGARTVPAIVGWERLPAPAEAGPDVFLRLSREVDGGAEVAAWIIARLRGIAELDDDALKALRRLASVPAGKPGATSPDATEPSSSTASPRRRRSSGTRSDSTSSG